MITRIKVTNYRCLAKLDFEPNEQLNILVGDNEAGKSTVLEAISLAITGRVRNRWASDDLNPHWFNQDAVSKYFDDLEAGLGPNLPSLEIEIFFSNDTPGAERLRGIHNSLAEDCPGVRLSVTTDPDHHEELEEYLKLEDLPRLIPTDLLLVNWQAFSGDLISRQPRGLGVASINVTASSSSAGVDYKLRQLIRDFVTPKESARISLDHRRTKADLTSGVLGVVNTRIAEDGNSFGVGLQMDQSANANWDSAVTPHMGDTPFALLGQGRQVATKIALALSRGVDQTQFVLVEEPENHLSHTELTKVLGLISTLAAGRQVFITTHSSFVLNRLGFDTIHLMNESKLVPLDTAAISKDTIRYFQKQSGYDTLRLAIAGRVVVVEGPSDEMLFNMAFESVCGVSPRDCGIDVVSLGTRGKRALELAKALGKTIAVLRDNDGKDPSHWRGEAGALLEPGKREMFVGSLTGGATLEPQIISANDPAMLRRALGIDDDTDLEHYMLTNKTESAWMIADSDEVVEWPSYFTDAIEFINGD